ncbi:glycosyltransferase family 1 protein [Trichoderma ceciliae]
MAPFKPKRILLITNIERGELNVFIATAQSLANVDPTADLHLATLSGLRDALPEGVKYHQISGIPMMLALEEHFARKQGDANFPESFTKPLGFANTQRAIRDAASIFVPYTGRQMVELFTSTIDIIKDVKPDLVVVNSLMSAGLTACYHLGIKFICLSPNSIKEFAAPSQPRAAGLYKFPALFSGFSYPVPWHKVHLNIYYVLLTVKAFEKDAQRKEVQSYLTAHAILRTPVDLLRSRPEKLKILVSTLPQLDFPLKIPPHVIPCGPIVRRGKPIEESDEEMAEWLAEGRTIYVNLGSLFKITEDQALEMARALKIVMDFFDEQSDKARLQVLWRLKKRGRYSVFEPDCKIAQALGQGLQQDRVRIVAWLHAEPVSILGSGHIVCSVHHGGANSYNEAIVTGIPQVVLPAWTDCYDYAQRVEFLGVGRWGSRTTKPLWSAQELSHELLEVLAGENSGAIKDKAALLKQACEYSGNGADCAALAILQECEE